MLRLHLQLFIEKGFKNKSSANSKESAMRCALSEGIKSKKLLKCEKMFYLDD